MLDESQAIAVRVAAPERHRLVARPVTPRAADRHAQFEGAQAGGRYEAAVPGQVDVDLVAEPGRRWRAQGSRQRVDHVGQAAGLGPGLALGSDHRDAHRDREWYVVRTPLPAAPARSDVAG